jgi:hypothetical protein
MKTTSQPYPIQSTEDTLPVYLRFYKQPRAIHPFIDWWHDRFSYHNHCSLRIGTCVIHFWDRALAPQWVTERADRKLKGFNKEIFIGYTKTTLPEAKQYTDAFPRMTVYDLWCRFFWVITYTYWPKKNDCVHRCSQTLEWMGFGKTIYGIPDDLLKYYTRS